MRRLAGALLFGLVSSCHPVQTAPSVVAIGSARIDGERASLVLAGRELRVRLVGSGRSETVPPGVGAPRRVGDRVVHRRSPSLVEWWSEVDGGFELGFDLDARPNGKGPLVFDLEMSSSVGPIVPTVRGDRVLLVVDGLVIASVRELAVVDARGRTVPARFVDHGKMVRIEIDDDGAEYPLHVDPIVGIEQQLLSPAPSLYGGYGAAVAVSGSRVLVGENQADPPGKANAGLAHVYASSGSAFALEATLAPTDAAADDFFGGAVALDGDTGVVAASAKDSYRGAAYVFVRSGSTWTQQAKLVASDGANNDAFGSSVAIAGNVALIGAPNATVSGVANAGAAYLFTRTGTSWSSGTKVVPSSSSQYGTSVAISGSTIAVGAANDSGSGAAFIFTGSGSTWTLQKKLSTGVAATYFGQRLALDGDTIAVSAHHEKIGSIDDAGAAYVFTRSGTTWTQQARLVSAIPSTGGAFGTSIGLSGNLLAVGDLAAPAGSVHLLTRSATIWTEKTRLLGSPDNASFGYAVDIDGDVGAFAALTQDVPGKTGAGAVHVYTPVIAYANGASCSAGGACASGFCIDGFCCNSACTESCKACNVASARGTCTAIDGTPVGARTCTPSKFCAAGACSSACTMESDCAAGYFCDAGTCKAKSATATCKDAKECASGFCVDGQCCDRACDAQCEACDVSGKLGTCTPVSGAPHADHKACDALGSDCASKTCDGASDVTKCTALKNVGASCKEAACSGGDLIAASTCDDKGACIAPAPSKCGRYSCDPTTLGCRTSCTTDGDCAGGFTCIAGTCAEGARCSDDKSTSIAKSGESSPCAPFLCGGDGKCASTCNGSNECAPGAVCDTSSSRCVPVASDDGAGGCSYGPRPVRVSGLAAFFALALLARRRRA